MGLFGFGKQKHITATIPTGRVLYKFRALKEFWSEEFKSLYYVGGVYSVRDGNEKLALAVTRWVSEDKVEVL